ncbi:MAG: hypothetical protein Q8R11_00195 [bacterium]|nr:hypothetical protein [bacterium]
MKTFTIIASFLVVLTITLGTAQVVLSNTLATKGKELGASVIFAEQLQDENDTLRAAVNTLRSMRTIASRSGELGFIAQGTPQILSQDKPLAFRP